MLHLRNEKYNELFRGKKGVDYDYTTQLYEDYNLPWSRIPDPYQTTKIQWNP